MSELNRSIEATVYYGRDRGEDGEEAKILVYGRPLTTDYDFEEVCDKIHREEYLYIFADGKWHQFN